MARKSHPNLPMTLTAFKKEIAALNGALRQMLSGGISDFSHAKYGQRISPDNREDAHNVLRERLDPAYAAKCDLDHAYDLQDLKDLNMRGPVVLDLYVYEDVGYGESSMLTNAYAYFKNGKLIGVAEFDSPNNASLLEAVQQP